MGAQFNTMSVPARFSEAEVRKQFEEAQDQDRYDNGHSYSGGFGMATGLKFIGGPVYGNVDDADKYLQDACQKWEEALAIKHQNIDGTVSYIIGALCAS